MLNLTAEPIFKNGSIMGSQGIMLSNISNSEQVSITLPAIKPKLPSGVQIEGNIWSVFHIENSNTSYVAEIGQVSAQSV